MAETLPSDVRAAAIEHVLRTVHPDRLEASVEDAQPTAEGWLVGLKVAPRGYLSTASYAVVAVDEDGRVRDAEACTGVELRRRLA